jgi:hypothetical protein
VKELAIQTLIEEKIFIMRGQKVMLDRDLADLYGVPVKVLNQQVKRNKKRFPEDFMFKLDREENNRLGSQIVTLTKDDISLRSQNAMLTKKFDVSLPYAFTEQGVAMLSSVLNSDRAIQVNIEIMRSFIKIRNILSEHKDLLKKIDAMEKNYDRQFRIVFQIIRELNAPEVKDKKKIGFKTEE